MQRSLDICIPTCNESTVILSTLTALLEEARAHPGITVRLIVADNGSTDGTAEIVEHAAIERTHLLRVPEKGKGHAIHHAARASDADHFAYIDADLSASPQALFYALTELHSADADIVIGSRLIDKQKVTRGTLRTFSSEVFNALRSLLLPLPVQDAQCGLKVMNSAGLKTLLECSERGWFLDTELLARMHRKEQVIREVPIAWSEITHSGRTSKLRVLRDGIGACIAFIRIRRAVGRMPRV